jgi:hypothetical protein
MLETLAFRRSKYYDVAMRLVIPVFEPESRKQGVYRNPDVPG